MTLRLPRKNCWDGDALISRGPLGRPHLFSLDSCRGVLDLEILERRALSTGMIMLSLRPSSFLISQPLDCKPHTSWPIPLVPLRSMSVSHLRDLSRRIKLIKLSDTIVARIQLSRRLSCLGLNPLVLTQAETRPADADTGCLTCVGYARYSGGGSIVGTMTLVSEALRSAGRSMGVSKNICMLAGRYCGRVALRQGRGCCTSHSGSLQARVLTLGI